MQKIMISQQQLDQGDGQFHEYMLYVQHRIPSNTTPAVAMFQAGAIIERDGLSLSIGGSPDNAGANVVNWCNNFYGERGNVSLCLPPVAYQLFGIPYLLRMPVVRPESLLLTQAVIDLTDQISKRVSEKHFIGLEQDFNEFYAALYAIARFDPTTVVHLESAAQRIHSGAVHYALSRWETLHFVERAMKEILEPLGVKVWGAKGHDISGFLHDEWMRAGKKALPSALLADVYCTADIRYEKTPQPFMATLRAHHSAIRLGALIAREIPAAPEMEDKLEISLKDIARDGILALARVLPALAHLVPKESGLSMANPVRLLRD